jgi:hypothetical protein
MKYIFLLAITLGLAGCSSLNVRTAWTYTTPSGTTFVVGTDNLSISASVHGPSANADVKAVKPILK